MLNETIQLDANYLEHVKRVWTAIVADVDDGPGRLSASATNKLHMRVHGEYQEFLESRGDGRFTQAEIQIIGRNLENIPGPIPTVNGWLEDRNSLSMWIALVKRHWAEIDGPVRERRGVRTDFRTQMKARWTPVGSDDSDQGLDQAIDRVFFFLIRHLYELDPVAINLQTGKRGHREGHSNTATEELFRQCLQAEGFAINEERGENRRHLKYARPGKYQIASSLAVLDDCSRFPKVEKISRRTGKQHIEDWKAMKSCTTFEGVGLNKLHCGTFNVVRVQLFRYWLFFHASGDGSVGNRLPQAIKPPHVVHCPKESAIVHKGYSVGAARVALRTAGSPLSRARSISDYTTLTARSASTLDDALTTYSAAQWPDGDSTKDWNHQSPEISHVERLEVARGQVSGEWQQDELEQSTSDHMDDVDTSGSWPSDLEAPEPIPPTSLTLQCPRPQRPEDRRQARFFDGSGSFSTPSSRTPRPPQGQTPRKHIEFTWRGRVYETAAPRLDQIHEVMDKFRKKLWVCSDEGRFLDPNSCFNSGLSSFKLERKQV